MSKLTRWLDHACYPNYAANWDDELLRARVLEHLKPIHTVLDIGAGTGRVKQMNFRGLASKVIGVDRDRRVAANPNLDEGIVCDAKYLPFENERFDLVVCDNVLEHLHAPGEVLSEVKRVLRPGGLFVAKTPNKTHYMTLISRLSPTWFHRLVNRLRGRPSADTFPTLYRVNSPGDVLYYARQCGFEVKSISLIEGRPEYLRFSFLTYIIGLLYERLVNSSAFFSRLRVLLIVELKKPT
jgi:SAM-dependent methyltransferase